MTVLFRTSVARGLSFLLGQVFLRPGLKPGSFWTKPATTAVRRAVARPPPLYLRCVAAVGEFEAVAAGGSHGAGACAGSCRREACLGPLPQTPAVARRTAGRGRSCFSIQAARGAAPRRQWGRGKMAASWWRSGGAGVLRLLRGGRPVLGAGLAVPARGGWRFLHGTQELLGECWAAAGLLPCGESGGREPWWAGAVRVCARCYRSVCGAAKCGRWIEDERSSSVLPQIEREVVEVGLPGWVLLLWSPEVQSTSAFWQLCCCIWLKAACSSNINSFSLCSCRVPLLIVFLFSFISNCSYTFISPAPWNLRLSL